MAKYKTAVRIKELESLIPEAECRLAHMLNRHKEIEACKAPNIAYKRKLIQRYKADIKSLTDQIANYKMEYWDLQELDLPRE